MPTHALNGVWSRAGRSPTRSGGSSRAALVMARASAVDSDTQTRARAPKHRPRLGESPVTLQRKTLLLVSITLIVAMAAVLAVSDVVVMGGFRDLEGAIAVESVVRARAALDDEAEQIRVELTDWSSWDDMYQFAADRNEAFIASNLLVESLHRMNLAAALIFDADGAVVWQGMADADAAAFGEPPVELSAAVKRAVALGPDGSTRGILRLLGRAYLFAAEPILNSTGTGATRGTLAFLRPIDGETLARISRLGALEASFCLSGDPAASPDMSDAASKLLGGVRPVIGRVAPGKVSAYTAFDDAFGNPALILRADTPRLVYEVGQRSTRIGMAMVLILGLLFGLTVMAMVRRLVLRRVIDLESEVQAIGWTRQFSERLSVRGRDEISRLTKAINKMLRELEAARAEADAANHAKSQFLARMSHEIRTPMTAILGYADLLDDPSQTEQSRSEHVRTIRAGGQHLLSVINDVLDHSKIEAGKMTVERIEFSPTRVLEDVLRMMSARAAGKGLSLLVEFDTPIPAVVRSDPTRLQQILVNLIGNAIKFCEAGSVRVGVRVERAEGGAAMLAFDVRDTGIGMTERQLSELFKPFTQADTSTTRRFGGTGLGLSISWNLSKLLGGEISAHSTPGQGSTFTATIPAGAIDGVAMLGRFDSSAPLAEPAARTGQLGLSGRVLLAEDSVDNQRLVAFHLQKAGAEVTIAVNGQVAMDLIGEAQAQGRPFKLVLMDMEMPVLDGYEASRRLRAQGCVVPIVALTAHAMSESRAKCLAAGCDDFATKPIDRAALLGTCAAWIERSSGKARQLQAE